MNNKIAGDIQGMLSALSSLQKNVSETINNTYANMDGSQREQFVQALKDGGIEKIAKENADKVVELNKMFGKK